MSCVSTILIAQTKEIDLLTHAIQNSKDDKEKSDLYSQLAEKLFVYDLEKGLLNAEEALRLSIKANYKRGQAQALTSIGAYHNYNGDYKQSSKFYHEAVHAIRGEGVEDFPVRTFLRLSILYRQQAYFDSSSFYLNQAKEVLKDQKLGPLHASLFSSQGLLAHTRSRDNEAISLLKKSLAIRLQLKDSVRIADTWCNMGLVYTYLSQYDSADNCYSTSESFLHRINDPERYMYLNLNRGQTAFAKGDFSDAIQNYTRALGALKNNTYKRYYALILFKIGELYEGQGAYHTAYDYLFNALKEFEKINARQDIARAYTQIGWCYNYQENYSLALENANQSLIIAKQIGDSVGIAQNQNLIGFTYYKTKKYKEALASFEQAVTIRKKLKHWWGVSFTLYNTALTYIALGETGKAFDLLSQSLEIDNRIGKKFGIVFTCNELGYQYAKQKNFSKASYYLDRANKLAKMIQVPPQLLVNYKNYIFLYEQKKDDPKIIKYFKLYTALKDSLSNELNSDRISNADAFFQLQKKAAEVELVNKENELSREKIKTQQTEITFQQQVIIIVSVCLFILFVLAVLIYKLFKSNKRDKEILRNQNTDIIGQKEELQAQSEELTESNQKLYSLNIEMNEKNNEIKAQSEQIKESNEELEAINDELEKRVEDRTGQLNKAYNELETFFYRTSHDFRRPLTTYLGLAEVAKTSLKDKQALELFEKVRETTLGLDGMLVKLQSISNMDSISVFTLINLPDLIKGCCQKYYESIRMKQIKLTDEVTIDTINSNASLLKIVIENLIENAINFSTPDNPSIKIKVSKTDSTVNILIEDNGQGIPEEVQPKIFDMYYRGNTNSKGNGLGLYIAKRAMEKLGGYILFKSIMHKGSSFEIIIPV